MNTLPTDVEHYKVLFERHFADSQRYQAQLFHAYESLRQQAKGLKRQARRIKRLRFRVMALEAQIAHLLEGFLDIQRKAEAQEEQEKPTGRCDIEDWKAHREAEGEC